MLLSRYSLQLLPVLDFCLDYSIQIRNISVMNPQTDPQLLGIANQGVFSQMWVRSILFCLCASSIYLSPNIEPMLLWLRPLQYYIQLSSSIFHTINLLQSIQWLQWSIRYFGDWAICMMIGSCTETSRWVSKYHRNSTGEWKSCRGCIICWLLILMLWSNITYIPITWYATNNKSRWEF